ncbi:transposase DNA-binding-containing protein [Mesorhizobium sp.]|nr:transposase DNA-binding-containing protein [Mesorhizobium sp.]
MAPSAATVLLDQMSAAPGKPIPAAWAAAEAAYRFFDNQ